MYDIHHHEYTSHRGPSMHTLGPTMHNHTTGTPQVAPPPRSPTPVHPLPVVIHHYSHHHHHRSHCIFISAAKGPGPKPSSQVRIYAVRRVCRYSRGGSRKLQTTNASSTTNYKCIIIKYKTPSETTVTQDKRLPRRTRVTAAVTATQMFIVVAPTARCADSGAGAQPSEGCATRGANSRSADHHHQSTLQRRHHRRGGRRWGGEVKHEANGSVHWAA